MISLIEGHREILRLAEQAVRDVWSSVLGESPSDGVIRMEGVAEPQTFRGAYYTRSSLVSPPELQNRANVGQLNNSTAVRYRNEGLLFIQVFGSKAEPSGYMKIKDIASALRDRFTERSTPSGIYFKRVRVNDRLPKENQWLQVHMVAEWQFDEIRVKATG
jgi:hypothetical protein